MEMSQYDIYHEDKIHTPSDFPYNTYLCTIPLDFKAVKTHWHDEIEIIVIKKGTGIVTVDLSSYTVKSGDIVFVFPGQLHSIEQKDDYVMEYENILFKSELLKSSGQDKCSDSFVQMLFSGNSKFYTVINHELDFHAELLSLINAIDSLCSNRSYGYQLAVKGYLFRIIYVLISAGNTDKQSTGRKKSLEKIKSILIYISENYQNPISIEEISAHCYYSKSYFMRFFKENMGMGFIQYLNDFRLEIAAKMLHETDSNIIEIASASGFDNLSYFNRSFKKKYGISPGNYRRI